MPMQSTYAVAWDGRAGRAELSDRGLELSARGVRRWIPFTAMPLVVLAHGKLEVGDVTLTSLDRPGTLRELAERLTARLSAPRRL